MEQLSTIFVNTCIIQNVSPVLYDLKSLKAALQIKLQKIQTLNFLFVILYLLQLSDTYFYMKNYYNAYSNVFCNL